MIELHWRERRSLTHLLKHTSDAITLRRVQAILWLDRGERVADVAERLGVNRQVIYQWVNLFRSDDTADPQSAAQEEIGLLMTGGKRGADAHPARTGGLVIPLPSATLRPHFERAAHPNGVIIRRKGNTHSTCKR